jgi:hypothetical protein
MKVVNGMTAALLVSLVPVMSLSAAQPAAPAAAPTPAQLTGLMVEGA